MFNFPNWFKKKEKQKEMPERVAQASKLLPESIKNLSTPELAKKINQLNAPNKWAITRFAASGKLEKKYVVGGNHYPPNYVSERRRQRRLKQIEKGIIKVTEVSNDGDSKVL